MKIKKSRPASQSTKVRKKIKTSFLFFHFGGYEVACLLQSLINTYHSPFNQFQRFLCSLGYSLFTQTGKNIETVNIPNPFPNLRTVLTLSVSTTHLHLITLLGNLDTPK